MDKSVESNNGHDDYCFNCHKTDATCYCTSCCRSYHTKCVNKGLLQANMADWRCRECAEIEMADQESHRICDDINIPLKSTIQLILEDSMYRTLKRPIEGDSNSEKSAAIYPMDLGKIEANVYNKRYVSTREFYSDIKWIYHNCFILLNKTDQRLNAAKYLLSFSKEEILSIETCIDCYLRANTWAPNWFSIPCTKPHLLLWAKQRGYPHWPAKLLAVHGDTVTVRFFGQHGRAKILAMHCRLMSENSPNKSVKKQEQASFRTARNELLQYIDNFEREFGAFNYAPFNAPFYSSKVEKYLTDTMTKLDGNVDLFNAAEPSQNEPPERSVEENDLSSVRTAPEFSNEQSEMMSETVEPMASKRKRLRSVFGESNAMPPTTSISSADKPVTNAKSCQSSAQRRSLSTSESAFRMPHAPIIQKLRFDSPNNIQRNVSLLDSVELSRDNQLPARSRHHSISVERKVSGWKRSHSSVAITDRMSLTRRNSTYVREGNINEMDYNPAMKHHTSRKPMPHKAVPSKNTYVSRSEIEGISEPIDAIYDENDDCVIVAVTQRHQDGPQPPTIMVEKSQQSAVGNNYISKGKGTVNGVLNTYQMVSNKQSADHVQELTAKIRSLERTNRLLSMENKCISIEYKRMVDTYKRKDICDYCHREYDRIDQSFCGTECQQKFCTTE